MLSVLVNLSIKNFNEEIDVYLSAGKLARGRGPVDLHLFVQTAATVHGSQG
jgi:hypothetical protein